MLRKSKFLTFMLLILFSQLVSANEIIVIMRHGEKPAGGMGQLNCQGLNRSLALPKVLSAKYGNPTNLFAPDTHVQVKEDPTHSYSYVRPLATIEPTAIQLNLPVNTPYGYDAYKDMANLLLTTPYRNSIIFVAWEHLYAVKLAQEILNAFGSKVTAPAWPDNDYDSLYVLNINWTTTPFQITFTHDYENLNNQSTICPTH